MDKRWMNKNNKFIKIRYNNRFKTQQL